MRVPLYYCPQLDNIVLAYGGYIIESTYIDVTSKHLTWVFVGYL